MPTKYIKILCCTCHFPLGQATLWNGLAIVALPPGQRTWVENHSFCPLTSNPENGWQDGNALGISCHQCHKTATSSEKLNQPRPFSKQWNWRTIWSTWISFWPSLGMLLLRHPRTCQVDQGEFQTMDIFIYKVFIGRLGDCFCTSIFHLACSKTCHGCM